MWQQQQHGSQEMLGSPFFKPLIYVETLIKELQVQHNKTNRLLIRVKVYLHFTCSVALVLITANKHM